jgi:hypothetical protein
MYRIVFRACAVSFSTSLTAEGEETGVGLLILATQGLESQSALQASWYRLYMLYISLS